MADTVFDYGAWEEKMIVSQLTGGMGNQMFIYAMGLAQARRLNTSLRLDLTTAYEGGRLRRPCLELWEGVKNEIVSQAATIGERKATYDQELVDRITPDSCLHGYWQTEKYFINVREELLSIFRPKFPFSPYTASLLQQIAQEGRKSAFLSVRRCEYLTPRNLDLYGQMTMEYYLAACKLVADNTPDPHFFVFSDDGEWCKQNFKLPYRFTVVNNCRITHPITGLGREDEHIWPMRCCHHAIIPNSSFPWWGAWLSQVPDNDRIVVGPKKWFNNLPADSSDLLPDRWIKL